MLSLEHIGKTYPNGVHALDDISFTVEPGEIVAVIGGSGCGKSTLLRAISALDRPTQGRVVLDGQPITSPHEKIGIVFQEPRLLPWLTVADNVAFGLTDRPMRRRRHRAAGALSRVGLGEKARVWPRELSGGQAQRVAIARALVPQPELLLLDEPFSALDAFTRVDLQDHLLDLWNDLRPMMILVTHDVDEAIALADRIMVMRSRPGRSSRRSLPIWSARAIVIRLPLTTSRAAYSTRSIARLPVSVCRTRLRSNGPAPALPCGGSRPCVWLRPACRFPARQSANVQEKSMDAGELRAMQAPIKERYKSEPKAAFITLKAKGTLDDSNIACKVETGRALATAGLHPATGGSGLELCSGDMLLEALVACAGVTVKAVATALDIPLKSGKVSAEGDLDFRGTLGVAKDAPVGFAQIRLRFDLDTAAPQEKLDQLLKLTERYCVVYQTIKSGPPVDVQMTRV